MSEDIKKVGRPSKIDIEKKKLETREDVSLRANPNQKRVKVKFHRPKIKLTQNAIKEFCFREVVVGPGKKEMIFDSTMQSVLYSDKDNFYNPLQTYELPVNLAVEFINEGIKMTYIDNSAAKNIKECIGKADIHDSRIKKNRPTASLVEDKQ